MNWDDLRVFLAVARTGRLSRAARQLRVEHTTVARRLAALEAELDVPLFHRTARGYLLTPHGQDVLPRAEAMERPAIAIGACLRETAGPIAGRVRIALLDEFASHWLAPALPAFRARHPALELQLITGIAPLDLARGEAELAVRSPRPRQTGLAAVRLARTTTGLYASRELRRRLRLRVVDLSSTRGLPLLCYTAEFPALQNAPWFEPILAGAPIALSTNSSHTLLAAARAGAGLAVVPRFMTAAYRDLVAVSADTASGEMWLTTHPEFRRDPRVRAVAAFLRELATAIS